MMPNRLALHRWRMQVRLGIFCNKAAVTRLIGALLLEQIDKWAVQRARYMSLATIALLSDDLPVGLPSLAA